MMKYELVAAQSQDLEDVYRIIDNRIHWMDAVGIEQWNKTDYWGVYPKEHYIQYMEEGILYVMKRSSDLKVVGVVALLRNDPRWPDGFEVSAYYLHHLATDLSEKGVGKEMMAQCEELGKANGKAFIRLDCAVDNAFLNAYYQGLGYHICGSCIDGAYQGTLREKRLQY